MNDYNDYVVIIKDINANRVWEKECKAKNRITAINRMLKAYKKEGLDANLVVEILCFKD